MARGSRLASDGGTCGAPVSKGRPFTAAAAVEGGSARALAKTRPRTKKKARPSFRRAAAKTRAVRERASARARALRVGGAELWRDACGLCIVIGSCSLFCASRARARPRPASAAGSRRRRRRSLVRRRRACVPMERESVRVCVRACGGGGGVCVCVCVCVCRRCETRCGRRTLRAWSPEGRLRCARLGITRT